MNMYRRGRVEQLDVRDLAAVRALALAHDVSVVVAKLLCMPSNN